MKAFVNIAFAFFLFTIELFKGSKLTGARYYSFWNF